MFQSFAQTTIKIKCTRTKISSTHDRAFDQHLTNHSINHVGCSQKPKLENVLKELPVPRPELLLSHFCNELFENFRRSNWQAKNEKNVVTCVIPIILDECGKSSSLVMNKTSRRLRPFTDATIPFAKPDFSWGALSTRLSPSILSDLGPFIFSGPNLPILPNFFLEVKGPDGRPSVASRQARYVGAIGARGIHCLQNYRQEELIYDDHAYTFSSTYQDGHLVLFAHHLTAPPTPGGRPEYRLTQLKSFSLTSDPETFIKGVTAFRNVCDFAMQCREAFIKGAESRHQENATASGQGNKTGPRCSKTQRPAQEKPRSKTALGRRWSRLFERWHATMRMRLLRRNSHNVRTCAKNVECCKTN